jgi:carboxymethylenebutenolidase
MPAAEEIEIPTVDGPMPALQWLPPAGRGPGILLLQEIFGLSSYIHDRAAALADLGYVVVAPALYWRLGETTVDETRSDYLDHAIGLMNRLDWGRTTMRAPRSRR